MAEGKIHDLAMTVVQFAIEAIQEHRRAIGHDPLWLPNEKRLEELYSKALEYVKSIVEEDCNG